MNRLNSTSVLALTLLFSSCLATRNFKNPVEGATDSVVAAIDGMDEKDKARSNLQYKLVCKSGKTSIGQPRDVAGTEKIFFPGNDLADGETCALQVFADVKSDQDLVWYSKPKTPGLYYGSNYGQITARTLKLTIYKVYGIVTGEETFTAQIKVQFNLGEGDTLADVSKMTASMVCTDADKTHPGVYKAESQDAAAQGLLIFENLKVKTMKGQSCSKAVILVDSKEAYGTDALVGVEFQDPKKGETLPNIDTRFVLKPSKPTTGTGDVGIDGQVDGLCVNYDTASKVCTDRKKAVLPRANSYLVAKIQGKTKTDDAITIYVIPGKNSMALFADSELKIDAIEKDSKSTDQSFTYWDSAVRSDLFKATFNQDFIDLKHLEAGKKLATEALSDYELLHIETVYVHGFNAATEASINQRHGSIVKWLALIEGSKTGETSQKVVVTGNQDYFKSVEAPLEKDFFDMKTLVDDLKSNTKSDKWRLYGINGQGITPAACTLGDGFYLGTLSGRHEDNFSADSLAEMITSCELTRTHFKIDYLDWTITETYYIWGWASLKL
jgi:hypothetical protein